MAIQSDITTPYGLVSAAYIRVSAFSGDKDAIKFNVVGHLNHQARRDGLTPLFETEFNLVYPTNGLLVACYDYLKANVYIGAVDC